MAVTLTNETRRRVSESLIVRAVEATLKHQRVRGDVSVVIIGDAAMKRLNKTYRGFDKVTDVLSFAEAESELAEKNFLGELIVDYRQILRQAKTFAPSADWEFAFIIIHGTLHLLGYDDVTEKGRKEMEKLGMLIMKKVESYV